MAIETQGTVGAWIDETFPGTDPESIRLLAECVELCLASGATQGQIEEAVHNALLRADRGGAGDVRESHPRPEKIPAEAAKVLIVLYGVASMRDFDLHFEVDKEMKINRSRSWPPHGDGTGYHIPATGGPAA
jgi:hypothetical protein